MQLCSKPRGHAESNPTPPEAGVRFYDVPRPPDRSMHQGATSDGGAGSETEIIHACACICSSGPSCPWVFGSQVPPLQRLQKEHPRHWQGVAGGCSDVGAGAS